MLHRLAFTAIRLNRPEPERDHHPLARADGGWYPGKHFDPTDILTDPRNWLVWKQFLIFFFSMIGLPIATFLGIEMVLRNQFKMHVNQSTTIGALASMIVLQALVFTYVRLAAIENNEPDEPEASTAEVVASAVETSSQQLTAAGDDKEAVEESVVTQRKVVKERSGSGDEDQLRTADGGTSPEEEATATTTAPAVSSSKEKID